MSTPAEPLRIALAHHWFMSMRGGEKTAAAIARLFPDAVIYTLIARFGHLDPALRRHPFRTSWLHRLGWIPDLQRKSLPVLVHAARSLDARDHDVVICSDAATIKMIRTRTDAMQLCYCHSPIRYAWDLYDQYYARAGVLGRWGLRRFTPALRAADRAAAQQVTAFIANSRCVADRIQRCYGRSSVIIHPPVDTNFPPADADPDDFYLVVGEQVPYKRNDLAVEACTRLGRRLVVIGTGPMLDRLRREAGPTVQLLGWQSDEVVRDHLRRCRALLFCGEEDFGLVPVEAQAAGRPVIALRAGGALDSVRENETGLFFDEPTAEALIETIERFESQGTLWPAANIQQHTRIFSVERFERQFKALVDECVNTFQANGRDGVRQLVDAMPCDRFVQVV